MVKKIRHLQLLSLFTFFCANVGTHTEIVFLTYFKKGGGSQFDCCLFYLNWF